MRDSCQPASNSTSYECSATVTYLGRETGPSNSTTEQGNDNAIFAMQHAKRYCIPHLSACHYNHPDRHATHVRQPLSDRPQTEHLDHSPPVRWSQSNIDTCNHNPITLACNLQYLPSMEVCNQNPTLVRIASPTLVPTCNNLHTPAPASPPSSSSAQNTPLT